MQATALRKPLQAVCWHRGPISGPLTASVLSALLQAAAVQPQVGDSRCEVRSADGFSLRLLGGGDEGFESDEEVTASADERLQEEIRVSDHALRSKPGVGEEDSSSANSSCSETDEPGSERSLPPAGSDVIHGADILFCHTDPEVPRGVLFVVRRPEASRGAALESIVLGCSSEAVAKELYTSYLEVTRRLKWERYTNSKRKSDVMRASFRNVNDSLRLRPSGRAEETLLCRNGPPLPPPPPSPPVERDQPQSLLESGTRLASDPGPHSLPPASEISRILSLSTPEDGWEARVHPDGDEAWVRGRERSCLTPTRYSHNKGPAPAAPPPAPRKHPTNPNLLLVPTKNGLEPYRVITGGEPAARPPLVLYAAEFAPHALPAARADWAHKMSQFDANNNRSRPPGRQQMYWVPSTETIGWGGARRVEPRPRARSKSPAGRHRPFELPGALSQALRGLTSHLKRPAAQAAAHAVPDPALANPKSVMKKRDRAGGSPEVKRVTFSAYSTVQVMD